MNRLSSRSLSVSNYELINDNLSRYIMLLSCNLVEGQKDKSYRVELFV